MRPNLKNDCDICISFSCYDLSFDIRKTTYDN